MPSAWAWTTWPKAPSPSDLPNCKCWRGNSQFVSNGSSYSDTDPERSVPNLDRCFSILMTGKRSGSWTPLAPFDKADRCSMMTFLVHGAMQWAVSSAINLLRFIRLRSDKTIIQQFIKSIPFRAKVWLTCISSGSKWQRWPQKRAWCTPIRKPKRSPGSDPVADGYHQYQTQSLS